MWNNKKKLSAHLKKIQPKGGKAVLKLHGVSHFKELARKSVEKRRSLAAK